MKRELRRRASGLPLAAALSAALSSAFAAATVRAQPVIAPATPPIAAPVTLVAELGPDSGIDPSVLREAIAHELGAPIVFDRDARGGTLVVRQEANRVVVSFDAPDGRHEGRAMQLARQPAQAVRDIALLAGNVARDQAAEFIVPEEHPLEPPPQATSEGPDARGRRPPDGDRAARRARACDRPVPRIAAGADFVPLLGSSSSEQGRSAIRGFSLGVIGALSGGVRGVAVSTVVNVDGSSLCGVELSGVANVVAGPVWGVQVSNVTNIGDELTGAQFSGIANVAGGVHGVQVATAVNVSSGPVVGMQAGTVNVARGRVKGVQIGLVNYAQDADFSLGLINILANGRLKLSAWGKPEAGLVLAAVKHGGAHFHYIYGVGVRPADTEHGWAVFGLGAHMTPSHKIFVDADLIDHEQLVFTSVARNQLYEARIVVGFELLPELQVFVGPTFNVLAAGNKNRTGAPAHATSLGSTTDASFWAWPGVALGVEGL